MSRPVRTYALVPLLLVASACDDEKQAAAPPPPPPEVSVAQPSRKDVPIYLSMIGETRGNTEIEIRARVEGYVDTVNFEPGKLVKKGDLLYVLDPRPLEASVAQARAAHAEAEAQLARAHQDVARYAPLVEKNAISRQVYETSIAVENAAVAAVAAAKAVVERAEVDLSYTKVTAPEDGLIGKTEVYAGTLVGRGQSTLLTRISRVDPIHARANITERDYLTIARRKGSGVASQSTQSQSQDVPFELILADGTVFPHQGKLVFLDRNVDPRTGTLMFEVAFPNPNQILRPGQYARIRAQLELAKGALLVPQRAVQELQGIYNLMVVGSDGAVSQRIVTVGERVGPLWRIVSGLKPEERVVVDGLQKIRPGMKVVAKTVPVEAEPGKKPASVPSTGGGK